MSAYHYSICITLQYCYISPLTKVDYIILFIFIFCKTIFLFWFNTQTSGWSMLDAVYRTFGIKSHYDKIYISEVPGFVFLYNTRDSINIAKAFMHLFCITRIMRFVLMSPKNHILSHMKKLHQRFSRAIHHDSQMRWSPQMRLILSVSVECNLLQWERKPPAYSHHQ